MLQVFLFGIITIIFVVVIPVILRKSKNVSPTKNIFENFIENDHGYPWSWDAKRIDSYKKALKQKKNGAEK
tara:strand:- start:1791 stop:2003 length:213 start_codon:yes stop_codon:yes gene_type:complete